MVRRQGDRGTLPSGNLPLPACKSNLVQYDTMSLEDATLHEKDKHCVIAPTEGT